MCVILHVVCTYMCMHAHVCVYIKVWKGGHTPSSALHNFFLTKSNFFLTILMMRVSAPLYNFSSPWNILNSQIIFICVSMRVCTHTHTHNLNHCPVGMQPEGEFWVAFLIKYNSLSWQLCPLVVERQGVWSVILEMIPLSYSYYYCCCCYYHNTFNWLTVIIHEDTISHIAWHSAK